MKPEDADIWAFGGVTAFNRFWMLTWDFKLRVTNTLHPPVWTKSRLTWQNFEGDPPPTWERRDSKRMPHLDLNYQQGTHW